MGRLQRRLEDAQYGIFHRDKRRLMHVWEIPLLLSRVAPPPPLESIRAYGRTPVELSHVTKKQMQLNLHA